MVHVWHFGAVELIEHRRIAAQVQWRQSGRPGAICELGVFLGTGKDRIVVEEVDLGKILELKGVHVGVEVEGQMALTIY